MLYVILNKKVYCLYHQFFFFQKPTKQSKKQKRHRQKKIFYVFGVVHIISTKLFPATDKPGLANQYQYFFATAKQRKIWSSIQEQRPEVFFKKSILKKNWAKFKNWLRHRCFPVNILKFPKTSFLQNIFGWLLLSIRYPIERGLCV